MSSLLMADPVEVVEKLLQLSAQRCQNGAFSKNQRALAKEALVRDSEQVVYEVLNELERAKVALDEFEQDDALFVILQEIAFSEAARLLTKLGFLPPHPEWFEDLFSGLGVAVQPLQQRIERTSTCVILGSGTGEVAFLCHMLFDFGKVLGLEANGDLHDSAVHAHRIFENKHSSILHAFAFNPELCFMCQDPAHMDSMDVVKDADVVVIDGTRIENKYTLATRLESTCKPGSLMVLFHMELPGPQFETLHRVNVSSLSSSDIAGQDEASFSVIVQRRAADSKTAHQVGKREDGAKDRGSSFSEDDFDVASSTGSLPKRLLRNEALAHVSSPVGSQLMKVKHGRQIGHSNLGASATGSHEGLR
eukprot:g147.t1